MPLAVTAPLALVCHPDAPDAAVRAISVLPAREPDGSLTLDYTLSGDLAALRIPDAATGLPRERLWAHTCFELFVATPETAAYREFNFSPDGQWMRFDFADYRQRAASADPATASVPPLVVRRDEAVLQLTVRLPVEHLPASEPLLGLTAVVEHADGSLRYWALRHPPGRPDFHRREGFAFALKASNP